MSEPLDLSRPLWQLYLVEGLEGERHAYISKTHHALVDGVAAVDVGTIMLDASPRGTEMEVSEERWEPDEPSPELLFVRDASDRIRSPLRAARKATLEALTMPRSTAGRVMRTAEGFAKLAAGRADRAAHLPQPGDRARPAGRVRRQRARRAEGDARRLAGATVNDVILSVSAGALRRCFERRGEAVPDELVALVPMSVRRPDEELELGNRIATLLVRLPVGRARPAPAARQLATTRPRGSRRPSRRAPRR